MIWFDEAPDAAGSPEYVRGGAVRRVERVLGLASRPLRLGEIEAASALPRREVCEALVDLLVRGRVERIGESWIPRPSRVEGP